MFRIIAIESAIKAFYFLMAIDGNITEEETEKLNQIGNELDSENFEKYKDLMIEECSKHMEVSLNDIERYDLIQEGMDEELVNGVNSLAEGISPRHLLWNLLTVAHSDEDYSINEKRLIAHVARMLKVDKSIVLEMEQLVNTADAVERELDALNFSDRPYAEIRPIIDEIEKRKNIIVEAAKNLISDDVMLDTPISDTKTNIFAQAGKQINDAVAPAASQTGKKVKGLFYEAKSAVSEKATPMASDVREGVGKIWGKVKDAGKNK